MFKEYRCMLIKMDTRFNQRLYELTLCYATNGNFFKNLKHTPPLFLLSPFWSVYSTSHIQLYSLYLRYYAELSKMISVLVRGGSNTLGIFCTQNLCHQA